SHTVFLEPEGRRTLEFYLQNFSTSLPTDVQIKMVRTLPGLEKAEIMRPGYAIEYDFVYPTQLKPSLETKDIEGLFMAGQINGTSGYEEAAAQGLIAGINAALKLRGEEPLILSRAEAYIGVLIDDLVTKGTEEPYRILTSRAEYRLLLRQDNADFRLMPYGYNVGLIRKDEYERFLLKKKRVEEEIERLNQVRVPPTDKVNELLRSLGSSPIDTPVTLAQLLKRPEVTIERLLEIDPSSNNNLSYEERKQVEIEIKYEGYIKRELSLVEQFKKMENRKIPADLDYDAIPGLSNEGKEKLKKIKPISIGQASRISGVSPADISLLTIYLSTRGQSSS
ncbi:MAG: tRNA uridine-5-carboxymethylaminomethyl(34) synthesis enzyme MnmG, partial [Synergistetes bacterium]|nr:tRNA uridine-5-carboxymethylaminomethyl(34) synthesis enzyme MnmG [Synergistota bacterium]MDW8192308.1 FAD-dependent oxidoreductase [Synergistota bacterium]